MKTECRWELVAGSSGSRGAFGFWELRPSDRRTAFVGEAPDNVCIRIKHKSGGRIEKDMCQVFPFGKVLLSEAMASAESSLAYFTEPLSSERRAIIEAREHRLAHPEMYDILHIIAPKVARDEFRAAADAIKKATDELADMPFSAGGFKAHGVDWGCEAKTSRDIAAPSGMSDALKIRLMLSDWLLRSRWATGKHTTLFLFNSIEQDLSFNRQIADLALNTGFFKRYITHFCANRRLKIPLVFPGHPGMIQVKPGAILCGTYADDFEKNRVVLRGSATMFDEVVYFGRKPDFEKARAVLSASKNSGCTEFWVDE